jgi:23S rRNA (adenine2030-N6)-methyltransferase
VAETRLHPLTDPMRMNGCALVLLGGARDLEMDFKAAADWVAANAGGVGALAKVWRLKG